MHVIYTPPHFDDPMHSSLYDGITNWATHAQQWLLASVATLGIGVLGVVAAIDWRFVPVAGCLVTATTVAGWGLLEQRAAKPHSAWTRAVQTSLVIVGSIGAILSGCAFLFWVMGPAPEL
jgi:formate hydrogenlyase subunit 3/multisubunit Na+/H+ antiporter MnhD subunit